MKKILPISFIIPLFLFSSCGSDKTKTDETETKQKTTDTVSDKVQPEVNPKKTDTTRSNNPAKPSGHPDKNSILAHIDQYLVTTVSYPDPGTVVIKNTLSGITVQKAIIEVTILNDKNVAVGLDYYIVNNIEPGDSKTIQIKRAASGVSASSRVVKLNSNELTGGETIIVGSKQLPL